ncbi:MAG TPA: antitoxin Xre-like helix-turn-helix domain-containing protein [Vicinamibacterales bacterium]|nr:antitoxin Xre-like helix-turn-helix domain-containing protein [Vicinamibacterales bacterium]
MTASDPHAASGKSASRTDRRRLGEILVAGGAVTETQLERALAEQARLQLPLGQTLLKLGYTTDEIMRQALSSQLGVPYIDLQHVIIDRSLADLVDRDFARRHALFPVARIGRTLTIAMDDPTQTTVVDELATATSHAVTVVTSSADAIQRALARLYEKASAKTSAPAADAAPSRPISLPKATHGYAALLGLTAVELPELLRAIDGGLAYNAFEHFARETGLDEGRLATFADIGARTLAARHDEGRFSRDESDRLVRAARILGAALDLFHGDRATAIAWLTSSQPVLGGQAPIALGRTDLGAREVERALAALTKG